MEHTAGVLRAVERMRKDMLLTLGALISPHPEDVEKATKELADIIAEETAQPELLALLKESVMWVDENDAHELVVKIRAAIKRAEGEK